MLPAGRALDGLDEVHALRQDVCAGAELVAKQLRRHIHEGLACNVKVQPRLLVSVSIGAETVSLRKLVLWNVGHVVAQ